MASKNLMKGVRILVLATAAIGISTGIGATGADAAPKKKKKAETHVRISGPVSYSYQAGPRTRVYITRRSWLDAGPEVLPGERKFADYAFPPGYHYGRTIDRIYQGRMPLSDNFDIGGYPERFPLY
jgi:hypothetical protein